MSEALKALRNELFSARSPARPTLVEILNSRYGLLSVKCAYSHNANIDQCSAFVEESVKDYLQRKKWWKVINLSVEVSMYAGRLVRVRES